MKLTYLPSLMQAKSNLAIPHVKQEIKPFPFQLDMIQKVKLHIEDGQSRILMIAPCGAGKTMMASLLAKDEIAKGGKILFLVDLNCLVSQALRSLASFGLFPEKYQGRHKPSPKADCIVASIQSLSTGLKKNPQKVHDLLGNVTLIFADEAHDLAYRTGYTSLMELYPGAVKVGLTATPYRLSSKEYLGQHFDQVVAAPPPSEMIRMGRIVPGIPYSITGVFDLDALEDGRYNFDYQESLQTKQATTSKALELTVTEWQRLGEDRPTVAYCASVDHAKALSQKFNEMGIPSDWQCGETLMDVRRSQDAGLQSGRLKVICSIFTQTKGWDLPCVGCVIFCRATKSKALFMQCAGRACRSQHGKENYLLMDFGGNLDRFRIDLNGDTMDINIEPKKSKNKGMSPYKTCPNCGMEVLIFSKVCECGHLFMSESSKEDDAFHDKKLKEYYSEYDLKLALEFRELKRKLFKMGINPDIALISFSKKYNYTPPKKWHYKAIRTNSQAYKKYLESFGMGEEWVKTHCDVNYSGVYPEPAKLEGWRKFFDLGFDATFKDLKAAYHKAAKIYHPDVCPDLEEAENMMKSINLAFEDGCKEFDGFQCRW